MEGPVDASLVQREQSDHFLRHTTNFTTAISALSTRSIVCIRLTSSTAVLYSNVSMHIRVLLPLDVTVPALAVPGLKSLFHVAKCAAVNEMKFDV